MPRVPQRSRPYRVVLLGPSPEDLAKRCAEAWIDLLGVAQRFQRGGVATVDPPVAPPHSSALPGNEVTRPPLDANSPGAGDQ